MTIQKEIREGIASSLYSSCVKWTGTDWYPSWSKAREEIKADWLKEADIFLSYLSLHLESGEVKRELPLPKWEDVKGTAMEVDSKMLAMLAVILDRATKAGYVAVEPLIKDDK